MVDFDANTPQLRALEKLVDAYVIPTLPDVPIQTKESRVRVWKEVYSLVSKQEVVHQEVIEAPGKAITHSTCTYCTSFGATYTYDCLTIFTFVEEDGELKILYCKDFADPQQRGAHTAGTAKAVADRVAA